MLIASRTTEDILNLGLRFRQRGVSPVPFVRTEKAVERESNVHTVESVEPGRFVDRLRQPFRCRY